MSASRHVLRPASAVDAARAALALAAAGASAALLRPHRFIAYCVHAPAIGAKAGAAALLQGGLLFASLRVWRVRLGPALLAWAGAGETPGAAAVAAQALFTAAWAAPCYAACVVLSIQLAGEVAGLALSVRGVATAAAAQTSPAARRGRPTIPPRSPACPASLPGPAARAAAAGATAAAVAAGARPPRAASSHPRPAAAAAGVLFRAALMGSLLGQAAAARALLPGRAAGLVAGFLTSLIYGWYTFDYAWVASGMPLPARLAALEAAWPFFAAFGAVAAGPSIFPGLPALEGGALTTALFPVFVVLAVDAGPGAGAVAAAAVANKAAAARGVALSPTTLPILMPAIFATTALVVRAVPAGVGLVRWAASRGMGTGAPPSTRRRVKVGRE